MLTTLKLRADSPADIERAASILREGGTVAFPTETVYGLGANALDSAAVSRIFEAKQRPNWDPLIVHVADAGLIDGLAYVCDELRNRVDLFAQTFWPGPLTLLLPKRREVPDLVTAGRPLVGIRVPAHPAAQKLLQAAGIPVAAPSANTFGHISPTTAQHVLDDLDGRIDAVLDDGQTEVGVESTVLDPTQTPMVLYRPGAFTAEQIAAATGIDISVFAGLDVDSRVEPQSLPSPGVGIRHYAPRATVRLVEGGERNLKQAVMSSNAKPGALGVLLPTDWSAPERATVEPWGSWGDPAELAANLFAGLRALDARGVQLIFCPLPPPGGLNDATRDRLLKAARPA